ncbi:tetratricopeptide repeat protein [Nonomuraea sp. MG754425]|uniref:tetratricopeptide repeat protein n=1 Tax=Nonomuraea sp. MG754425 TaxID=2570319 RepID=UPI001F44F653|nr:tetratricopeptide repeat protein [Nonomuraea sp. MG754425]MCF6473746.1 tetratricopeptide repeat protein [Nonomuraea sp. MG754425]
MGCLPLALEQAAAFVRVKRRSDEALPLLGRVLAITETTSGPDHPDVAVVLSNMVQSLCALGTPGAAAPLLERALGITRTTFAPDRADLAVRLLKLTVVTRGSPCECGSEERYGRCHGRENRRIVLHANAIYELLKAGPG